MMIMHPWDKDSNEDWRDLFSGCTTRRVWYQTTKHYLMKGIDVNAEDDSGRTALSFCEQDYGMQALLISYGANAKHVERDGITLLMAAFKSNEPPAFLHFPSCVRLLLENGADPSAVCNYGCNALLYALDSEYENMSDIRLLFEYNMDLEGNYVSLLSYLVKPLLYTVYDYENFEVAELFFEYGVDMTRQSWLLDTEHLPAGLRGNDELYNKLLQLFENPLDLSVLARNKVRRLLGRDICIAVTQLGLPKHLQHFVLCK